MNFSYFVLLATFIYNTISNDSYAIRLNKLEKVYNELTPNVNNILARLIATKMLGYLLSKDMILQNKQTVKHTNIYRQLCDVFVTVIPQNHRSKKERLFWETNDKIYLNKDSTKSRELEKKFYALYLQTYKQHREIDKTETLMQYCYVFSRVFVVELTKSTQIEICRNLIDRYYRVCVITISLANNYQFQDNRERVRFKMHINYADSRVKEEQLCFPFMKEKVINYIKDLSIDLLKNLAEDEILRIESNLNVKFVTSIITNIRDYERNDKNIDCVAIMNIIYTDFISNLSCFLNNRQEKVQREGFIKNNLKNIEKPMKYCEISSVKEKLILRELIASVVESDSKVNEIIDFVNDVQKMLSFMYLYKIFDYLNIECTHFDTFLKSFLTAKSEILMTSVKIFKNNIVLQGDFLFILVSFAKHLRKVKATLDNETSKNNATETIIQCMTISITNRRLNLILLTLHNLF